MWNKIRSLLDRKTGGNASKATTSSSTDEDGRENANGPDRIQRNVEIFTFSGDGYDEHLNTPYLFPFDSKKAGLIIETGGRRYRFRKRRKHILFREETNTDSSAAFYLTQEQDWLPYIPDLSPNEFAKALRAGAYGRVQLYVAPLMKTGEGTLLFFARDGSGFASHEYQTVPFTWNSKQPSRPGAIMPLPSANDLRELCETIWHTQINPNLSDPYKWRERPRDVPLRWEKGSERDLRSLTRAICYTEPGLFEGKDAQIPVTVVYVADSANKRGGLRAIRRKDTLVLSPRLQSLCNLAGRLNRFVGETWHETAARRHRRSGLHHERTRIEIVVSPPTMHERTEALLALNEELGDKLHRPEKRAWLRPSLL